MVPGLILLTNVLFASVVVAIPYSRLEARLARRRGYLNLQSKPINHVSAPESPASDSGYSSNWAGAVWNANEGTFTSVTGTFTAPTPSGSGGSAAAWVGIDGDSCKNAILQTGVDFTITNGVVSYDAWYEWYPDYAHDFNGIAINAGDQIRASVTAFSTTSGKAVIENLTTGQTATQELSSSSALCEQNAEWVVETYDGSSLADFGTVTFGGATVSSSGGTYTPSGANIVNIEQNGQALTSVTTSGDSVTIQYA